MAAPALRILAYGDSLTAGYHNDGDDFSPYATSLAPALSAAAGAAAGSVAVDVSGASGLTAVQLVENLDTKTLYDVCDQEYSGLRYILKRNTSPQQYTAALVQLGTNDLADSTAVGGSRTAEEILAAITSIHTLCHTHGLKTVALPIPPNKHSATKATARNGLAPYQAMREQVNGLLQA